jgi:hypothetical protein
MLTDVFSYVHFYGHIVNQRQAQNFFYYVTYFVLKIYIYT